MRQQHAAATQAAQTWTTKGHHAVIQGAEAAKAARVRQLLATNADSNPIRRLNAEASPLPLVGMSRPLTEGLRYRRTLTPEVPLILGDGAALLAMVRRTSHDRRDRVVLAWPCRPDNGFITAALHLLEGRARGHHVGQSVGLWPWRAGITRAGQLVTVEPHGLVRCASAAAQDRRDRLEWTSGPFGTDVHEMVHLCLRALEEQTASSGNVTVRRPSLLDLTSVFQPVEGRDGPYVTDTDQVMHRARRYHPRIRSITESSPRYVRTLGDPRLAPLAVFGLPAGDDGLLRRCLGFERFSASPMNALVVDLTRTSLADIGESWPKAFARLLTALDGLAERRPGVVVLAEDVFVMRKAECVMREAVQTSRSRRPTAERMGLFLRAPGFLEPSARPVKSFNPIEFRADLKDGRLLALRDDVLRCARTLEEHGDTRAAVALRSGLSFVRAMATLPIGLAEARKIVETMYGTEDDADRAIRRKFFVADALQPLTEHARISAEGGTLETFRRRFMATVEAWQGATPISAKLASMSAQGKEAVRNIMLVLPDRHVVNLYNLSDPALTCRWHVADPKTMLDVARTHGCDRWLLVRPNGDMLRTVLMADPGPKTVDLLGDAAGSALLDMGLRPLTQLQGFAPVRDRALALLKAVGRSASSIERDQEEAQARTTVLREELDFTQSEGGYTGPRMRLSTEQDYTLLYRPGSEVLCHTPDDLRAFEKVEAKNIQVGDAILVLNKSLMELLRRELARSPKTVETLRQYHASVGAKRKELPGDSLRDKARNVLRRIQAKQHEFGDHEVQNITRWLDVDGSTLDDPTAQPQGPKTRKRFQWFTDALQVQPELANVWWDYGIRLTRSYRLSEGMQFNQRATSFVLDPESFTARAGGRDLHALQQAVLENVDVVKRTEMLRG